MDRQKAKHLYKEVASGRPGRRFQEFYRRRGAHGQHLRIGLIIGGIALLILGAVLGPVPLMPGFVFGLLGLGLLAAASRPFARWMDKMEIAFWRRYKGRSGSQDR